MLQKNNISKLNINLFVNLTRLQFINLSYNKLKIINKLLFKYNTNLKVIYIEHNKLIYFNIILDNFHKLTDIILYNNTLSTLNSIHFKRYLNNESTKYESNDRYINIKENKFKCNNSMNWIPKLRELITIDLDYRIYCRNLINNKNITLGCFLGIKSSRVNELINC